jgi:anti-sigma factor RsiW
MPSDSDPAERLRTHFRGERHTMDQHPSPEQLIAYAERRLPAQEADALREHLAACPDCTAELLGLAELFEEEVGEGSEVSPADLDAAWARRLPQTGPRADNVKPLRRAWNATVPLALAAALLAVVALVQWRTIVRLSQPQANPPLINLEPAGAVRQGDPASLELRLAPEMPRAWVILNPVTDLDDGGYDVDLAASDGRTVLRWEGLRRSEAGNFRLEIPGEILQAGDYRFLLTRPSAAGRHIVEEFRLSVRRAPPAAP